MPIKALSDPVAKEAIDWHVFLSSGEATQHDLDAYQTWRRSDPKHETVCQRLESMLGKIDTIHQQQGKEPIRAALLSHSSRRQLLHKAFCLSGVMLISGLVAQRYYPLSGMLDDYATGTGELRKLQLDDGGQIQMDARTGLDIAYTSQVRTIRFHRGGIFLHVPEDPRPLQLITDYGSVIIDSCLAHVRYISDQVHVGVIEGIAKINTTKRSSLIVSAGQGATFSGEKILARKIYPSAEVSWLAHRLEVHDQTLAAVVSRLQDYTPALLHVDDHVANLRVSGVFPLGNIPYTLDALAQTMPIAVTQTFNAWIRIGPLSV